MSAGRTPGRQHASGARAPAGAGGSVKSVNYATSPLLASPTPPWRTRFVVALEALAIGGQHLTDQVFIGEQPPQLHLDRRGLENLLAGVGEEVVLKVLPGQIHPNPKRLRVGCPQAQELVL